MNRWLIFVIAALPACLPSSVFAAPGITGSLHDFADRRYGTGTNSIGKGQTCLPCHIPHNAIVKTADGADVGGPLWNHTLSTATYTLYTVGAAPTVDGQTVTTGNVDTNSMLCLSCHDGTVAIDSFGGGAGTRGPLFGMGNLTDDLSDDHPIGDAAIWPDTTPSYMVDPSLRAAQGRMPLRVMPDGRMAVGCTSCHEPHNRIGAENMLWYSNTSAGTTVDGRAVNGSILCFNCHKK